MCLVLLLLGIWQIQAVDTETVSSLEQLNSLLPPDLQDEPPTILIALLVRNKGHILPYVLSYLEEQNYPKQRLALW